MPGGQARLSMGVCAQAAGRRVPSTRVVGGLHHRCTSGFKRPVVLCEGKEGAGSLVSHDKASLAGSSSWQGTAYEA